MYCNFTIILLLIFTISAITGVTGSDFQILTNYMEVENKAVLYAKTVNTIKGKVYSLGSNWRKTICNTSSLTLRIEFCKKALQVDYYGLEFDLNSYTYSACEPQNFWTKSSVPYQLDMFTCPPVIYKDMETNEKVFLPYTYAASRGKSSDTAFMFVQEETSKFKYPLQYIKNINFDTLKKGNKHADSFVYQESWRLPKYSSKLTGKSNSEQRNKTYEKFRRRFNSMDVCGLRRRYKIFVCRLSLEEGLRLAYTTFKVEGYDATCRKHEINFSSRKGFPLNKRPIRFLLCPPIKSLHSEVKLVDEGRYYISTSTSPNTINIFHRQNKKGQKLHFLRAHRHSLTNIAQILRDFHRERFIPYPSEEQRAKQAHQKSVAQIINEMNSLQSTSAEWQKQISQIGNAIAKRFYTTRPSPYSNPSDELKAVWVAEDLILSFSKIKTSTPVYKRFMDTYQSTGSCDMSESQHRRICDQVAMTITKQQKPAIEKFLTYENSSCHQRQVLLRVHEAEDLETDSFTMRQCQYPKDTFDYQYFIGKTHIKNTALVYKSFFLENDTKFDPHAAHIHEVIININPDPGNVTNQSDTPQKISKIPERKRQGVKKESLNLVTNNENYKYN